MALESWIAMAKQQGASDLHVEAGMPLTLRIRGTLQMIGQPVTTQQTLQIAKKLLSAEQWAFFIQRRSYDFSKTIDRVRCRINVLQSSRGVGLAIRLLSSFEATLEKLNLHPDLIHLLDHHHGLVLVSGPTGSGKSTTIAAFVQELNLRESLHIVTVENPIEYMFRPKRSLIRQREVGRDTPSFEQALLDAMREDPDVLVVGEMREPQTMRLTLNAAETGHLVFSTLHSSTAAEALQRIVSAFPAEIQSNVCAQLADCLLAVVCQRLLYRDDLKMLVPECEILTANQAVRSMVRQGNFSRLASAIETGGEDRMWTFDRYRRWLERRTQWFVSSRTEEQYHADPSDEIATDLLPPLRATTFPISVEPVENQEGTSTKPRSPQQPLPRITRTSPKEADENVLVLEEEEDLEGIISSLTKK